MQTRTLSLHIYHRESASIHLTRQIQFQQHAERLGQYEANTTALGIGSENNGHKEWYKRNNGPQL